MANIALTTANKIEVVQSLEQHTAPAAEDIVAGAPVRIDATTGNFTNANGTTSTEAKAYGIATRTVKAGWPVTAVAKGILGGFTLAGNFNTDIYLSDNDGRLADAAGTVSKVVGNVFPAFANTLGTTASKLLRVTL